MPSFGEQLRRERERRSITLDDISVSTKISTRLLRALEEDHFEQLPGGIFNKGFIRAYAKWVTLASYPAPIVHALARDKGKSLGLGGAAGHVHDGGLR